VPHAVTQTPPPPRSIRGFLLVAGPGIVVAATGVGAGDLVAAAKAGAVFGLSLLWTAALGVILKFALAEGVGRWQLATGSTVIEGWSRLLGRPVRIGFLIYFLLWTLIVAAALMSACGLAAHAMFPQLSVTAWAILHALGALAFVWFGGYGSVEHAMKLFVGMMFVAMIGGAVLEAPPVMEVARGLVVPWVPENGTLLVMGIIGGIGGTLTLLSYNYWMAEKGWRGAEWARGMRFDLGLGYTLTGLFGIAVIILGATVLMPHGVVVSGPKSILEIATRLGERFGPAGGFVFLAGFWGAVFSSLLGVWQGVPYLFGDYVGLFRPGRTPREPGSVSSRSALYRGYAVFMTFPPMLLLLLERPIWLVLAYAVIGALFMPFLAATLLYMNNRPEMGRLRNGWLANVMLAASLILFACLGTRELLEQMGVLGT
jgi:Mn2+/Fe2+ NRAMP family transporter